MKHKNSWSTRLFLGLGTVAASVLVTVIVGRTDGEHVTLAISINAQGGLIIGQSGGNR
jgi:nucleoside permease NupC